MIDYIIQNLPYIIISCVGFVAAIIIFVKNLLDGKSFKDSIKQLKEDLDSMRYRTVHYQETEGKPEGTTFSQYRDDYFYDDSTGELVKKELPIDVQAQINSYKDVAISKVLERLMPTADGESDEVDEYYATKSELDVLTDAYELAGDYIDRYGLDENSSFDEIVAYVSDLAKKQRESLISRQKIEDTAKEVVADDTQKTQIEKD